MRDALSTPLAPRALEHLNKTGGLPQLGDRASPHHDCDRGVTTRRPIMRKLITTIVLLALVDGSAAIAQPAGPRNPAAPPSMNSDQQMLPEAPVGHRQPRADQVPSQKNLMNPNDPVNQENAALDRMINGICRGC